LLNALRKIFPQFKTDFTDRVPEILNMSPDENISADEWSHMFDWKRSSTASLNKSPAQRKKVMDKSMARSDDNARILKKLGE
jgi:hypothetical protein